jgi:hypothetical protein
MTVAIDSTILPRPQKISKDLFLDVEKITLTTETLAEGGLTYAPARLTSIKSMNFMMVASGAKLEYNMSSGKIQFWNMGGSHTHAVALDTGVSAEPSELADYPARSSEKFFLASPTAGQTRYLGVNAAEGAAAVNVIPWVVPADGFIIGIRGNVGTAPSAGKSYAVTLVKGGVDTTMTFSIADANTYAEDFEAGHKVTVAKGDLIVFKCVETAAGAAANFSLTMLYEITTGAMQAPAAAHTHAPGTLADAETEAGTATTPSEITGSTSLTFYAVTIGTGQA